MMQPSSALQQRPQRGGSTLRAHHSHSSSTRPVRCRAAAQQPTASQAPPVTGAVDRTAPQHQHQQQQLQPSRRGVLASGSAALLAALVAGGPGGVLQQAVRAPPAAAAGPPAVLSGEVKAAVDQVLDKYVTKQKAPVLLRLAYHDAASHTQAGNRGGANGSIQFELDRPENFGLKRGWNVIKDIASALERTPASGAVSKADLIALAAARAVSVTGGPRIELPVGRRDATAADPPNLLVSEAAGVEALKANFADKGLGVQQLVALSGAHTLGGKGFGDPVTFDNAYYTALLAKPWLNTADEMSTHIGLPSDHVLPDDPECNRFITAYANDQSLFFRDFVSAFKEMTSLGVEWV